ncbi:MAG: HU family DNA-binding protein [Desulfomonilaceae bacterium]|jgi:nucleoid DNA-binding protein
MTKAEFVDKLAEKGKITKKLAAEAIELVFSTIGETLVNGDEIAVPGFGKFSVVVRKARSGLNPQTKQKINIPETKAAKFTAAKSLKESIK